MSVHLEKWKSFCAKNKIFEFLDATLSGYAQIAFCDNSFSAVLMILATWIGSPVQCICALWSTFLCTLLAYAVHVPRDLIRKGLYGFNGALSGLAIPVVLFTGQALSLKMLGICAIASIMCVFLTTSLRRFFGKWNIPALSSPYCVSVSLLIVIGVLIGFELRTPISPSDLLMTTPFSNWTFREFLYATCNGASQVLWVEKPICGILYLIAVLLSSRADTVNTSIALLASTSVSVLLGLPMASVMMGIYGFNAALLVLVIGKDWLFNLLMAAVIPIACVIFKIFLSWLGINTFLAFPYITICIVIFLFKKKQK